MPLKNNDKFRELFVNLLIEEQLLLIIKNFVCSCKLFNINIHFLEVAKNKYFYFHFCYHEISLV